MSHKCHNINATDKSRDHVFKFLLAHSNSNCCTLMLRKARAACSTACSLLGLSKTASPGVRFGRDGKRLAQERHPGYAVVI